MDFPEEESRGEGEELRRAVIRELGHVDRLLSERDKLSSRSSASAPSTARRGAREGAAPRKKLENQVKAQAGRDRRPPRKSLNLQPSCSIGAATVKNLVGEDRARGEAEGRCGRTAARRRPTAADASCRCRTTTRERRRAEPAGRRRAPSSRSRTGYWRGTTQRSSAWRRRPSARRTTCKRIVTRHQVGRAQGGAGQGRAGRGQPPPRGLDREEVHQPRPCSSST